MKRKLRLAVVGAGHLGRIHARLLSTMPSVELVAVADPSAAARESSVAECRNDACHPTAHADWRSLIGSIDAAVVATPTAHHLNVAKELLNAGVHALVEKPLAATFAEADELCRIAETRGCVLQTGHIERFNPAFDAVRPHVPDPKYIEGVRAGSFSFRSTDIGVVLDLMIHDIDLVLALVQSKPRRVEALGVAVLGQHEDVAQARIEFENGCVANLSASRVSHAARRAMQIWDRQAFASVDFAAKTASVVHPSERVLRGELDVQTLEADELTHLRANLAAEHFPLAQLEVAQCNPLAEELRDFVAAIQTGSAVRVSGRDGRDALALAEMILAKIDTHSWEGDASGPRGPLRQMPPAILRGPHWVTRPVHAPAADFIAPSNSQREAG